MHGRGARESWFRHFSYRVAAAVGTHRAFLIATAVVLAWAVTGPLFLREFEEEFKALRARGILQTSAARVAAEKAAKT